MKVTFNVKPNKGPRIKWTTKIAYHSHDHLLRALKERVTPAQNYIVFLRDGTIEIGVQAVGTYKIEENKRRAK